MARDNALYQEFITNSSLMFEANFSLTELNEMMPFERNTYLKLWNEKVEKDSKENKSGAV